MHAIKESYSLRAVLLNSRSVKNKFDELKELTLVNSWDMIGITETWIGQMIEIL